MRGAQNDFWLPMHQLLDQLRRNKLAFFLLTNKSFRFFRRLGVFVTPVHYYTPIPDIREIDAIAGFWDRSSDLPGIAMRADEQRRVTEEILLRYREETDFPDQPTDCPHQYYATNGYFDYVSAVAMHSFIRYQRPTRVVEVGAGNSTYVIANAMCLNRKDGAPGEVTAIDPCPNPILRGGIPGLDHLITKPVQAVGLAPFTALREGDILSIDTSHTVKTGSDVNFLYLEVLPRLAPGVLIHIHDIFLPLDYPENWLQRRIFWNEQYLLQAFLMFNQEFDVVWGQRYVERVFPQLYTAIVAGRAEPASNQQSFSFWLRRISSS